MNLSAAPAFQTQVTEADGSALSLMVNPSVTSINVGGDIINRSQFTDLTGVTAAQAVKIRFISLAPSTIPFRDMAAFRPGR